MKIENHKLVSENDAEAITYIESPNQGGTINPEYLIIHYTAGKSAQSSIDWFKSPMAKASAHLVIGMDGSITQMVPFNKKAWHAGVSRWNNLVGLNSYSIGIELDNPGKLRKVGNKWLSWFGTTYNDDVVLEAVHKNSNQLAGWHIYSEEQLRACIEVSQLIVNKYNITDILGHEDIAPFRKEDPGPAFPMESFKTKVMGRRSEEAVQYEVNTDSSNVRSGPGMKFGAIAQLAKGTKVEFIKNKLNWIYVLITDEAAQVNEQEGWIHSSLLTKV